MPTVLRRRAYRFFFFSADRTEPPHIHVERERMRAKFWLEPVAIADNNGFPDWELRLLADATREHHAGFLKAWHEHFG